MKVLFAASECAPIVKVGGLADVVGSLPKALTKLGVDAAIALPRYEKISARGGSAFGGKNYPDFLPGTRIPVFYLGTPVEYSGEPYSGGDQEHTRFANFSRQVVDFLGTRQFEAEILHLHDYHTGLVPDIIHQRKIKIATVLTIHDVQNQGESGPDLLLAANLSPRYLQALGWDLQDRNIDMLLQGIVGSDVVNTVSPTYAKEILDPAIGGALSGVLQSRQARVFGILNGIDQDFYDPRGDHSIFQNYGSANFEAGKAANKKKIQESLGLTVAPKRPLFGLVTRLVARKGIGLILSILPQLMEEGGQLVVLGQGEPAFESILKDLVLKNPASLAFADRFDENLAHQVYAAADFFLMPSLTEPCGLTQMIACRYGCLPIARRTGGLVDTVFDGVNGYVFDDFTAEALWSVASRAVDDYAKSEKREAMVDRAMGWDFSWNKSAREYVKLYEKALSYSFGIARGLGGEIRRDYSGNWGILSEARASRPFESQKSDIRNQISGSGGRDADDLERCPFEEGHEPMSAPEVFRLGPGEADTSGWQVRVVANKYPLMPAHEVIVYSPDHYKDLTDLPLSHVEKVVWAYLSRYRHHEERGYVHIFCNHGEAAAASLKHPHSQMVVLDELPQSTVDALQTAERYYESHGRCPYCQTLDREIGSRRAIPEDRPLKKDGPHFVWHNDSMALLAPYASDWPYELTILPLKHRLSFGNITETEMKDLAQILQLSLRLLKKRLGEDLGYNFWIHSLPDLMGFAKSALYYHWHVDVTPRLKVLGGVELGLGVMVDDQISPEKAAQELRQLVSEVYGS